MSITLLTDDAALDRFISISEKARTEEAIAVNDAFVAAMSRQIRKGKETAKLGTFVDQTPPISAIRIRGDVVMSPCGSPAAMCVEYGSEGGGTETMK